MLIVINYLEEGSYIAVTLKIESASISFVKNDMLYHQKFQFRGVNPLGSQGLTLDDF